MKKINIKGPIVDNDTAYVYHYFGWDACCADDVRNGLKEANGEDVTLEINSNGGMCTVGFEIYTMLREYEGKVTVHVINACSAATFAVCASDEALISDMGIVMIHNAQSWTSGDYRDMQMEADALKEFNQCILNAYMKKTGKSQEELQEMMNNDTYMSPQKAIEYGFCDGMMFSDDSTDKKSKSEPDGTQGNSGSDGWTNYLLMHAYNSNIQIMSQEKAHNLRMSLEKNGMQSSSKEENGEDGKKMGANGVGGIKNEKTFGENAIGTNQEPENTGTENHKIGSENNNAGSEGNKSEQNSNVGKKNDESKGQISGQTGSDITTNNSKGKSKEAKKMTLEEFLAENPEAKVAVDAMVENARTEGATNERARLQQLDSISKSVSDDALNKAKYGTDEERKDAKELAFEAMLEDGEKSAKYMKDATEDSENSGVNSVTTDPKGDGEEKQDNEADKMANYINKRRGVK